MVHCPDDRIIVNSRTIKGWGSRPSIHPCVHACGRGAAPPRTLSGGGGVFIFTITCGAGAPAQYVSESHSSEWQRVGGSRYRSAQKQHSAINASEPAGGEKCESRARKKLSVSWCATRALITFLGRQCRTSD